MNRFLSVFLAAALAQASLPSALGDTFGSGASSFEIEFVTVGSPGNPPDANPNPAGAVPYEYRIGKYEISEEMIAKANALSALWSTYDDANQHASVWKKIGDSHFQSLRQRGDNQQGRISFPTLHAPDIGPMMFRSGRKLLLAPTTILTKLAEALAELFLHGLHTGIEPCYSP